MPITTAKGPSTTPTTPNTPNTTNTPNNTPSATDFFQSPVIKGFAYSWVAVQIAEIATLPVDVCKVRLQLEGELGAARRYNHIGDALRKIALQEGVAALWKGLGAALWRQTVYGTTRYGSYEPVKKALGVNSNGDSSLWKKILAGCISGGGSSFIANPFDMVKIRMQADTATEASLQRHKGVYGALKDIIRTDGILKLWRGATPTVARAAVGGMSELSVYDEIKQQIIQKEIITDGGLPLHLTCALSAGLFSCFCMNPFDVAKSRIMNQRPDSQGVLKYTGMLDCFQKTLQAEGLTSLWKGFFASYARIGPRVVIIFLTIEQLRERFGR